MSDIHGNILRYKTIMDQINLQETDHLYVLGDIIDRFPDGITIMQELLKMQNCTILLGNHELMMLQTLTEPFDINSSFGLWMYNGGIPTLKAFRNLSEKEQMQIIEQIKAFPISVDIKVNDKNYCLSHSSLQEMYKKNDYQYSNSKEFAVWNRITPECKLPKRKFLIFGHTPTIHYQNQTPPSIWYGENRIGIDCGAGSSSGRLACLRLDDMKEFYSE